MLGVVAATILINGAVVFAEEAFHWVLPDNPDRYQLFYDLGLERGPPGKP